MASQRSKQASPHRQRAPDLCQGDGSLRPPRLKRFGSGISHNCAVAGSELQRDCCGKRCRVISSLCSGKG
jgi:hypothetical protein